MVKWFGAIALCLAALPAWAADITARVDRNPVALDESFQLVFSVEGSADDDPDFAPLEKDFEILGRSQNSSMQIINMTIARRTTWSLTLMAKTTGTLLIPAIAFGKDKSQPTWVTVQAAPQKAGVGANADLFIEVEAKPDRQALVQAQILYTVRLYRAVNVVEASLTEPKVSGLDAVVSKLGDDTSYESLRGNRRYVVTERRYAIYPQTSGPMVIEPVVFDGRYVDDRRSLRSKRLRSDALALEVQPIPAAAGQPWLPAAKVVLREEWPEDPPKFTVGEPVTRSLVLQAEGLTAAQLPTLSGSPIDGFKTYAEQPQLDDKVTHDGTVGTRRENVALVATKPGTYTLPEVVVPWWNLATRRQETARIPARSIEVLPAAGSASTAPPLAAEAVPETAVQPDSDGAGVWPWIAGITTLGWLLTLAAWWRQRRPVQISPAKSTPVTKNSASLKRLAAACHSGDAVAAKTTLLDWAKQRWPDEPALNLGQIARRLGGEAEGEILRLNEVLYGAKEETAWSGERLYQAIQEGKSAGKQETTKGAVVFPPLYS